MTPKLEERIIRQEKEQEQQLALLAAIIHAGRTGNYLQANQEARVCVEMAALLIKAAGQHIAGK